jgi:hypothetical protein
MHPVEERFWAKARIGDDCWEWQSGQNGNGYGCFGMDGKTFRAHRVAWLFTNGPIPKGEGYHGTCVLHRCDNRLCVKPSHLFLGTPLDNVRDCMAKGRANFPPPPHTCPGAVRSHCPQGHAYSGDNLFIRRNGKKACRTCLRAQKRRDNHGRGPTLRPGRRTGADAPVDVSKLRPLDSRVGTG